MSVRKDPLGNMFLIECKEGEIKDEKLINQCKTLCRFEITVWK